MEKTITIRITEELHKEIKLKCVQEGVTLKDYLVELIEKDLKENE